MSDEKTLRQRISDGKVLVALRGSLQTTKSQLADIWSTGRYDYIWIDGQHTAFSEESLVAYCTAAEELGIDVQLRIPHTRHAYLVGRFLDLGCSAVLVPEVMEEETVDDALDYTDENKTGKPVGGALQERKITMPLGQLLEKANYSDRRKLDQILANKEIEKPQIEEVLNMMKIYGSIQYTLDCSRKYAFKAQRSLENFPESSLRQSLFELADFIVSREV